VSLPLTLKSQSFLALRSLMISGSMKNQKDLLQTKAHKQNFSQRQNERYYMAALPAVGSLSEFSWTHFAIVSSRLSGPSCFVGLTTLCENLSGTPSSYIRLPSQRLNGLQKIPLGPFLQALRSGLPIWTGTRMLIGIKDKHFSG
jgi:hypothetical protein